MSSIFAQFSSKLSATLKNQGKSIGSFVIVILTATLNHLLTKDFFKCPRQNYKMYGWCFLIGPALMLAMMTLLLSFATSQVLAGICKHDEDAPARACFGKRKRTWKFIFTQMCFAIAQSLIAFSCWVVLTLLSTETYSCIKIGPKPNSSAGNKVALYSYISQKERFDSFSKIIGLFLLVTCLAVAMVVYFVMACCYTDFPDKLLPSMRRYDKLEAEAANETFTAHMTRVAKLNGKLEVHRALKIDDCSLCCTEDDNDVIFDPTLEEINRVRKFLARRYPRLENEANKAAPYRDEEVIWGEEFDVDETDGKAPTATATTTAATANKDAATQPDLVNCLAHQAVSDEGQQPNSYHVALSFVEDRQNPSHHQFLEMEDKQTWAT